MPVIELYFLFQAGSVIGGLNTIFIVILTGIVGAGLAKNQGRAILSNIQTEMAAGKMPADQLIHGFLVFAGGLLLLTPGFVTDIIGIALVFPLTRILFIGSFKSALEKKMKAGSVQFYYQSGAGGSYQTYSNQQKPQSEQNRVYQQNGHQVIDVEAERED